jgi:hypothetical protein
MNIKDFLDLPDTERQTLVDAHNKSKRIREQIRGIKHEEEKLRTRRLNLQIECDHPYRIERYEAHENEFGNYTGGGTYTYYCPDCDYRWTKGMGNEQ